MRKHILCGLFGIAVGVALGAIRDYKKNHEEVKTGADVETEENNYEDIDDMKEYEEPEKEGPDNRREYTNYSDLTKPYRTTEKKEQTVRNKPVVISPEEYGEEEYYTQIEFVYCSDGAVLNEDQEIVENPEKYIGDGLKHFGEYEDDSVYIRNDKLKSYFAVLKDFRKSTDFPKRYAH